MIAGCVTLAKPASRSHRAPAKSSRREAWVDWLDGASMNLIAQPLDGRPAYPLTQFTSGTITDFAWAPDGTRLAIARSMTTNDIVMFKSFR